MLVAGSAKRRSQLCRQSGHCGDRNLGVLPLVWLDQYLEAAVSKLTSKRIIDWLQIFASQTLPEVKRESLHRSLQVITSNLRPLCKICGLC